MGAGCVGDGEPGGADDGKQDSGGGDILVDGLAEVDAGLDAGDVHEDGGGAEGAGEVVEETAGFTAGVVSAVGDEDGTRWGGFGHGGSWAG